MVSNSGHTPPTVQYRLDDGKDIPGGATKQPHDWKPIPEHRWDVSKAVRHVTPEGLEYFADVRTGGVTTSREDTYLAHYTYSAQTAYMHDFLVLSIEGRKVYVLPAMEAGKGFPSTGRRTDDGRYIWTIGQLRGRIEIRDVYSYPWVPYGEIAPWVTWEGIGAFENVEEQKRFLATLELFLSILGTNHIDLNFGQDVRAEVEYSAKIEAKIIAGKLLL